MGQTGRPTNFFTLLCDDSVCTDIMLTQVRYNKGIINNIMYLSGMNFG